MAPLLAVLGGPIGYFAIRETRAAVLWCLGIVGFRVATTVAECATLPTLALVLVALHLAVHVAVVVDVARRARVSPMLRPRTVILAAVGILVLLAATARVLNQFAEVYSVPSASMYPTVRTGETVAVKKLGTVARGDVIAFRYPLDPAVTYLKRIVGVGGDVIAIKDGQLRVNGQAVERRKVTGACQDPSKESDDVLCSLWEETLGDRAWIVSLTGDLDARDLSPTVVPKGSFFVLGDNRNNSSDSRLWGPVQERLVVGKATFVFFPSRRSSGWSRVGTLIK